MAALSRIGELAREGAWEEIDRALRDVPMSSLSEAPLVTLLRGTFRFRSRLPGWDGLKERAEAELASRNADTARLMTGL